MIRLRKNLVVGIDSLSIDQVTRVRPLEGLAGGRLQKYSLLRPHQFALVRAGSALRRNRFGNHSADKYSRRPIAAKKETGELLRNEMASRSGGRTPE